MATLHDVAKKSGYSLSTISKVLHKDQSISEDTTKKVLAAIKEQKEFTSEIDAKMKVILAEFDSVFQPVVSAS